MIRIYSGDLLSIAANEKYYYALVLDNIRLFGGNWVFVFHRTSTSILTSDDLLDGLQPGFHAFVDFIWAKREDRLNRIAKKIDITPYNQVRYLKGTNALREKATLWFISDMEFKEIRRTSQLTDDERQYPLKSRIDDIIMARRVDIEWTPEQDKGI